MMPKFVPRQRKHKIKLRDEKRGTDTNLVELPACPNIIQKDDEHRRKPRVQQQTPKISAKKMKRLEKYLEAKLKHDENREIIEKLSRTKVDITGFKSSKKLGQHAQSEQVVNGIPFDRGGLSDEAAAFGSGLKRPFELDDTGKPIIHKRRKIVVHSLERSENSEFEGFSSASGSCEGDEPVDSLDKRQRTSAFKAWATRNRHVALDFIPSTVPKTLEVSPDLYPATERTSSLTAKRDYRASKQEISPAHRTIFNVPIVRAREIDETRQTLPIVAEEHRIMEAIHNHNCVIICGSTGSGKTTQVPQFLFEAGYGNPESANPGMIGVTQPRRVATISMANRVKTELGPSYEEIVSHQIRFNSSLSRKTAIKFMTDGILLREITQDFTLSKYSAIVIDEAHERTVNTDVLIGMLTRIVNTRSDLAKKNGNYKALKLIIMSATLRIADFTRNPALFSFTVPPVVEVEGRPFDVNIHFARKTRFDYLEEMFRKVSRGHRKLPQGGMLVFLTGQNEINSLEKRLKESFRATETYMSPAPVRISPAEEPVESDDVNIGKPQSISQDTKCDNNIDILGVDNAEDEEDDFGIEDEVGEVLKVHVLPLYSQLPGNQQMRVFDPTPDGSRLIVLATNVAETSITIPGIRYVFDCGRAKERKYNRLTGVQSFEIGWISKANANQRAGRAGRTVSGHCYRLFSSAVFDRDFRDFPEPEILRTPVEGVVLTLKSMGIPSVTKFPFPTSPERESLVKAENLLEHLGALSKGEVTDIGKEMAMYPLSPRLARILFVGQHQNLSAHTIALVAALAVPEIFIAEAQLDLQDSNHEDDNDDWGEKSSHSNSARDDRRKLYNEFHAHMSRLDKSCDAIKFLMPFCEGSLFYLDRNEAAKAFLRNKALIEANNLRYQLTNIVRSISLSTGSFTRDIKDPTKVQVKILRQVVAAGYIDQVAIRADQSPSLLEASFRPQKATNMPYLTLFPSSKTGNSNFVSHDDMKAQDAMKFVYIHPSSVLAHASPETLPKFIIYSHLSKSPSGSNWKYADLGSGKHIKTRMHPLTPITGDQLAALATGTPLLDEGKPIGKIEPLPQENGVERRVCWVLQSLKGQTGMIPWPLPPAKKVIQRRDMSRGWLLERVLDQ